MYIIMYLLYVYRTKIVINGGDNAKWGKEHEPYLELIYHGIILILFI